MTNTVFTDEDLMACNPVDLMPRPFLLDRFDGFRILTMLQPASEPARRYRTEIVDGWGSLVWEATSATEALAEATHGMALGMVDLSADMAVAF